MIMNFFRDKIISFINYIGWKFLNRHNNTSLRTICPLKKISVGKYTYGGLKVISYSDDNEGLHIGNYCSFAGYTLFILGGEHNYKNISTFPFKNIFDGVHESFSKGPIIIDDDAWIGYNVTILSGTHIGQGAIIGAGTTVSGDVPPYAIYTNKGIIKYRFSEKTIKKLLKVNFSKLKISDKNLEQFYLEINDENIDEILGLLKKNN